MDLGFGQADMTQLSHSLELPFLYPGLVDTLQNVVEVSQSQGLGCLQ